MARDWFADFWKVCHTKTGKQKATEAFARAIKRKAKDDGVPAIVAKAEIVNAMIEFAASPQALPNDRTPIHPTTWLNQGRFDDDRSTWTATASNNKQRREF